jgi:flagellar hook-basal body complex protein FliE
MTDPLGLIGTSSPVIPPTPGGAINRGEEGTGGFRALLEEQIARVNELQRDAKEAAEDALAGRRHDVEGVILATQKADIAFKMLLQVRNKVLDAYEEVKQIRV